jgi:phosphoglycerol transferase MdoB-like AlkP superfamily enzyme
MNYQTRKKIRKEWLSSPPILLVYRLLAILLAISISRWLLYLFNLQFFHQLRLGESLGLYFKGMRFDLSVLMVINLPLILYYCFPSRKIINKVPQRIIDFIYIITNGLAIFLNFMDIVCFHFFGKHITLDFLKQLGHSEELSWGIIGQVAFDYWYLIVIFVLFILVINVVTVHTRLREPIKESETRWMPRQAIFLAVMLLLTFIAWRGGLQAKPISMATARQYTDSQNAPILLNTPFCLANSRDAQLQEWSQFPDSTELFIHKDLNPNRFMVNDSLVADTLPSNLVLIIMKSVGQEMIGYYNPHRRYQLTPFLDSLLAQSLTFDGRSNSRRSLEAFPALLASIPSLMNNSFISSKYAKNDFDAFAQHLQKQGYNTIFMHGGSNGVMGYDQFSRRAGFKNYFGRIEYGDDNDYDGSWGIYDGPFLQYAAQTLNRQHGPFASAIYLLSSRYPYRVPKDFVLPEESYYWTGFEKTVYYADCALRDFFQTASAMPWFRNTLFVITSDYSNGEHFQPEYSNVWGMYAIPIAFYFPEKIEARRSPEIAQQIDLGPSVLSALRVEDTLFAFGRNLFDTLSEPTFISYYNLTYQYCDGTYLVQSDGETPFGIFKPQIDPLLNDNLIDRLQCPDIFEKLYRFLQEYNNRMINNNLQYHEAQE